MLHSTKSTVQTPVNTVLQRVSQRTSPDYQNIKRRHFLVATDAEIPESQRDRPLKSGLVRDFEWFEYNEGCLK
jgi:hypothetical protein